MARREDQYESCDHVHEMEWKDGGQECREKSKLAFNTRMQPTPFVTTLNQKHTKEYANGVLYDVEEVANVTML